MFFIIFIFILSTGTIDCLNKQGQSMNIKPEENAKIFEQILDLFRQNTKPAPTFYSKTTRTAAQIANIDCIYEKGIEYRGSSNRTARGTACLPWDTSETVNSLIYPYADLEGHNFCRNPDGDKLPWCWVDIEIGKFGFCSIPECNKNVILSNTSPEVAIIKEERLLGSLVQVRLSTYWLNVCADYWTDKETRVFCSNIGIRVGTNIGSVSHTSPSSSLHIKCSGNESSLSMCQTNFAADCKKGPAKTICSQYPVCNDETEMLCSDRCVPLTNVCDGISHCFNGEDEAKCEFFEVTLVDGKKRSEGRVELVINGMVGTICDDGWDDSDATVICRMLGYTYGTAVSGGEFGKGKGPIWFDDVNCKGWEEDIQLCRHAVSHDCTHFEDAGVMCHRYKNNTQTTTLTTKKFSQEAKSCGRRPIEQSMGRVIGGQRATYGAFPWQARIFRRDTRGNWFQQCGATLVHDSWVITAAHCVESYTAADYLVHLGDWQTSKTDVYEIKFDVISIYRHPDYGQLNFWNLFFYGVNYDYDIAALRIRPIRPTNAPLYNDYIQPVCLPTSNTIYKPGLRCEVSGWGLIHAQLANVPDMLHFATVPILSTKDCQIFYRQKMTSNMFCAGYKEGNIDTCQGDSGGPLVCLIDGYYTLLGVTSWGHGCGNENSPGIYTKVSKAAGWIDNLIKNN